jgi:hypothetical protein
MREIKIKPITLRMLLIVAAFAIGLITPDAHCQTEDGYSLLIQQSPPDSGLVTPGLGVLSTGTEESIKLTAMPKPGYRFILWLGDVDSPERNVTTVSADGPKIIIAVFERTEFDDIEDPFYEDDGFAHGGAGGRGGRRRGSNFVRPGRGGGGGEPKMYDWPDWPQPPVEEEGEEGEETFPVPGEDTTKIPVPDEPIPEPSTLILLGMGAVSLLKGRRQRNRKISE